MRPVERFGKLERRMLKTSWPLAVPINPVNRHPVPDCRKHEKTAKKCRREDESCRDATHSEEKRKPDTPPRPSAARQPPQREFHPRWPRSRRFPELVLVLCRHRITQVRMNGRSKSIYLIRNCRISLVS